MSAVSNDRNTTAAPSAEGVVGSAASAAPDSSFRVPTLDSTHPSSASSAHLSQPAQPRQDINNNPPSLLSSTQSSTVVVVCLSSPTQTCCGCSFFSPLASRLQLVAGQLQRSTPSRRGARPQPSWRPSLSLSLSLSLRVLAPWPGLPGPDSALLLFPSPRHPLHFPLGEAGGNPKNKGEEEK